MQYPDIYIPKKLTEISKIVPADLKPPSPPIAPRQPEPTSWSDLIPVGLASLVLSTFLLFSVPILIPIVSVGLTLLYRFFAIENYKGQLEQFQKDRERYLDSFDEYERQQKSYEQRDIEAELLACRQEMLGVLAQSIYKPDGYQSDARVGASEFKLVQAMNHHLNGEVIQGIWLDNPNYRYPYSPDICYIHKGIYFDVEVDEPYGYMNLKPIHGYDEWKDGKRNEFFTERLWVVIRFAEEQVVRYPDSCCKAIAETIQKITGEPLSPDLNSIPDLPVIPRWTTMEAESMAQSRYRDSYL